MPSGKPNCVVSRVREAAPVGGVHVGAQHVAARPRDVEAAQQRGEDDQGQQEREGRGDRCLDGDACARAHVRRPLSSTRCSCVRHAWPCVTVKSLEGSGVHAKS